MKIITLDKKKKKKENYDNRSKKKKKKISLHAQNAYDVYIFM